MDSIFMKTTGAYPEWVDRYRGNGCSVKKHKNGYALYSCTSVYVPGGKPKSVQKYLGMITEKDGLIPKSVPYSETVYIEFTLSRMIWMNYRCDLQRSVPDGNMDIVMLGIIHFIFGGISLYLLQSSALTREEAAALFDAYSKINPKQIESVSKNVASCFEDSFPDETDRLTVINGLKLGVIPADQPVPTALRVSDQVADLLKKRGLLSVC